MILVAYNHGLRASEVVNLTHAMLKHVHAEHSRETHVRAMAMVMEQQTTAR
jgi:hypothetical protein